MGVAVRHISETSGDTRHDTILERNARAGGRARSGFDNGRGLVRGDDPEIWGKVIMKQPFDTELFRQIRVPAWVQETTGCGYTLSAMDSKARAAAAAHGVTISELGFVDPFYAYYDSKLLKKRSPHVPPGRLEQDIAEYKRLGVRILGVYPPCLQGEVYEDHPDWRRIATNTTEIPQIDMKKFPHGGMLCLLGPYGDFFIDVLAEILTKYPDVDAFSFDGLHYGGVCYCEHCRASYRKEGGAEIPDADLNDPAFRRYQHWADRRMEGLVRADADAAQRDQTRCRPGHVDDQRGPIRPFSFDPPQYARAHESVARCSRSGILARRDEPRGHDRAGVCQRLHLGDHQPPHGLQRALYPLPRQSVRQGQLSAAGDPAPYAADPDLWRGTQYRRDPAAQPARRALRMPRPGRKAQALACSQEARTVGGPGHERQHAQFLWPVAGLVEERYMAGVFGAFRAAVEEHQVVTVINDWNLNTADLAPYKVLVLANTACLDDDQVAAIERFVSERGRTGRQPGYLAVRRVRQPAAPTSPWPACWGSSTAVPSRPRRAREELDVNFAKAIGPDYWEKRKNVFDFKQDVGSFLNRGRMPTYVGANARDVQGARRAGRLDEPRRPRLSAPCG